MAAFICRSQTDIDSLEKATASMRDDTLKVKNYLELAKRYMKLNYEQTLANGLKRTGFQKNLVIRSASLTGSTLQALGICIPAKIKLPCLF